MESEYENRPEDVSWDVGRKCLRPINPKELMKNLESG